MLFRRKDQRREFERLILPHLDAVHFAALRLVREPADADDLVQETFCKAYQNFKQLNRAEQGRSWLFSILFNTWKNFIRKKEKETPVEPFAWDEARWGQEVSALCSSYSTQDPEIIVDLRFTWHCLEEALSRLSAEHRLIIILADVEGFTYREIAAIIDVPIGTVMSRLSRARCDLERHLSKLRQAEGS